MPHLITVSASADHSLDWSDLEIPEEGEILWKVDFGITQLPRPQEVALLASLQRALEAVVDQLIAPRKDRSIGLLLFEGSADFTSLLDWEGGRELDYQEWLEEMVDSAEQRAFFARDCLVDFLERLMVMVPEELPLVLRLDATVYGDPLFVAELLNRESFQYYQFEGDGLPCHEAEAADGLLLPGKKGDFDAARAALRQFMEERDPELPIRLIPENFLTQEWHQLDRLHYAPDLLSFQGERKLRGFEAAGGEVIEVL